MRPYNGLHVLCDSHVENPKSPRGHLTFSTWRRFDSSEVSFDSSEVLFLPYVNFLVLDYLTEKEEVTVWGDADR